VGVAVESRITGLRDWMARHNLDAAYISKPVSIAYLTGFHAEPMERLMALAIRRDRITLILPALEEQRAARLREQTDVVSWHDGQDPYRLVHEALAGCANLGVEKQHLSLASAEALTASAGAVELLDVGPELRRMRLIKSEEEVEKLVRAAAITDAVTDEVIGRLRPGQTELAVAVMLGSAIGELGGTLAFESLVQSGANSALPHIGPTSRKLAVGDFVLLDFGAAFDGYLADTTRMAVVGEPSERHREIHHLVLEAHDAAIEAVRAGQTSGGVDAAARRVIDAAGMGERFIHRVGHGLGLEAHEDPSLDPGSRTVLEAGMVFTIEPGVYIPGFGGVRIEDDVVVEQDGCRVLTKADRSLRVILAD
jgi:Xaa-Pro dipeptidase